MRRPAAVALIAAALVLGSTFRAPGRPNPAPIPPTRVTLDPRQLPTLGAALAELGRQAGVKVDPGPADPKQPFPGEAIRDRPFWAAVEALAARTGTRVVIGKQGRQIALGKPTGLPPVVSTDGPFRVAARAIAPRLDLDTGRATYDLTLDVNWEPRFPVFRLDSQPKATGADDLGNPLTTPLASVKSPAAGYAHTLTVRVDGLSRKSGTIARLAGSFTATASPKMLTFAFDNLAGPLPVSSQQEGVTAKLVRFAREEDRWEAELDLTYPPGGPEFESFETWASGNVLKLVAPGKGRVFAPDSFDLAESSQRVRATYRFRTAGGKGPDPADRKGWRLVYQAPAPLVEFPVRFELTDIPLP